MSPKLWFTISTVMAEKLPLKNVSEYYNPPKIGIFLIAIHGQLWPLWMQKLWMAPFGAMTVEKET